MKPNSVKARVMAGDWHDKTVKEIAAELNCSKVSVTQALEAIEEETGEPVPHKSGDKREKLIVNGKELTLTEALLESDWSDLDAKGIADVLGVKPERVTAALYRYRTRTGKEIPHVKSKRGPKPKKKEPETDKPKEPDPAGPEDSPESDAAEDEPKAGTPVLTPQQQRAMAARLAVCGHGSSAKTARCTRSRDSTAASTTARRTRRRRCGYWMEHRRNTGIPPFQARSRRSGRRRKTRR